MSVSKLRQRHAEDDARERGISWAWLVDPNLLFALIVAIVWLLDVLDWLIMIAAAIVALALPGYRLYTQLGAIRRREARRAERG